MELSYEKHYQTSVPLLKSDEQLIEILEDHQVNTQEYSLHSCCKTLSAFKHEK